jgi:hypothetical protein
MNMMNASILVSWRLALSCFGFKDTLVGGKRRQARSLSTVMVLRHPSTTVSSLCSSGRARVLSSGACAWQGFNGSKLSSQ